jgi:butyryl-CoA dehydrogenase
LTPIAKSWPSEFGLAANDHAIQIHGGYGYTRDFDVEQVYRDNRLNPIHEGTHGIQAMDLLGRKIIRDKGVSLAALGEEIAQTVADASAIPALAGQASRLNDIWKLVDSTVSVLREAHVDPLANASPFLSAFGHLIVGWLWLDQAATIFNDADCDRAFREGKLRACRYFIEAELPKAVPQLELVASLSDAAATMPEDSF